MDELFPFSRLLKAIGTQVDAVAQIIVFHALEANQAFAVDVPAASITTCVAGEKNHSLFFERL
jgi:hypothetical protein